MSAVPVPELTYSRALQKAMADVRTTAADALQTANAGPNNVTVKIHLASGKEVDVSVSFGDGKATQKSPSVAVHTSSKLTSALRRRRL